MYPKICSAEQFRVLLDNLVKDIPILEVSMSSRIIEFPEINWEDLKKGALSKDKVWDEIEKAIKFLLEVRMLKSTSFLSRATIDNAKDTGRKLNELKEEYPQVHGVVQNLLGRMIKERAEGDSDSRTLFNRLRILTIEAAFHGSLKEWNEKDLEKVPIGLRKNFEVRLYNPRSKETRYFLPRNWRNETHKRTALVLRDLSFKARNAYHSEHEIPKKKEAPAKTPTEPKTKPKAEPKSEAKPRPNKSKKKSAPKKVVKKTKKAVKDSDRKRAAVQKKRIVEKARKAEDEVDIKKVKSLADIDKLVK